MAGWDEPVVYTADQGLTQQREEGEVRGCVYVFCDKRQFIRVCWKRKLYSIDFMSFLDFSNFKIFFSIASNCGDNVE